MASAAALVLTACGGGAGSDTTGTTTPPVVVTPPTETPADTGASTGPAVVADADSFLFEPSATLAVEGEIDKVSSGSTMFASWNPYTAPEMMRPGMKVAFFGAATGCATGTQGTAASVSDDRLSQLAALASVPAAAAGPKLRWSPSANVDGCDASIKDAVAPSAVYLNADNTAGAVGLLTSGGKQADGTVPFFGPYTASGQDGNGTNKYITGSFVAFRQNWLAADPLQPWRGSAAARVRSVQAVGAVDTASTDSQVKQQMMATFLNPTCLSEAAAAKSAAEAAGTTLPYKQPCQMQYMLNTNIVQNGISDWSAVSWWVESSVWYDSVQGGMPIVEGPIYASGGVTLDTGSGLELFRSQGSATQHGLFSKRTFDVTISFEALGNVMRLVAARAFSVEPAAVTATQMATIWGSRWNDRNAWVLLNTDVAQEVFNKDSSRLARIAGGFSSLFVGPQD